MSRNWRVAVVGAEGLVGEAILKAFAERRFPVSEMHALAANRALGRSVEFGDDELPVGDVATFDFVNVDLALFASDPDIAREHVERALGSGCTVVDVSGAYAADPDVPLIVPAVNADRLAELGDRRLVASPGGAAVALASVLNPLRLAAGLERVDVVSLEAASGAGRDAVEDLAGQCAQLLNGRTPGASAYFPAQLAFSAIPLVGEADADGATAGERALVEETAKILGESATNVTVTAVRLPVFFGDGLAVHVATREPLSVGRAAELLGGVPGIRLETAPTLQDAVAAPEAILVGRLRQASGNPRLLEFWVAADNVRRGSAVNTVDIVEVLVRDLF
jgi:aspartate-semialdehyde dehydrogenase